MVQSLISCLKFCDMSQMFLILQNRKNCKNFEEKSLKVQNVYKLLFIIFLNKINDVACWNSRDDLNCQKELFFPSLSLWVYLLWLIVWNETHLRLKADC